MQVSRGLEISLFEGAYSTIMTTLTGGIFLTGMALYVGATNFQIALLSTLTTLATVVQLSGSFLIERLGNRLGLCFVTGIAARLLLLVAAVVPFAAFAEGQAALVWLLIIVISLSNLLSSIQNVSWLSWMKDLVPEKAKGDYFSRRNLICGALGLAISLVAGMLFDQWQIFFPTRGGKATGFFLLFVAATAFGLLAVSYLPKIPEPRLRVSKTRVSFWRSLTLPFRDRDFRLLMMGHSFRTFGVWIAAPFFGVYMLRNLELSYTTINLLSAVAVGACLAATRLAGRMTDRFGNKPVLMVCIFGNAFFPLLMAFTTPTSYGLLVGAHLLGFFVAGLGLGANNILLKLSPRENSAVYLAAFSSMAALATALGPLAGGIIMSVCHDFSLDIGVLVLDDVKLVFVIACALRLLSLGTFMALKEPESEPVGRMIRVLWQEVNLNPFEGFGQMVQGWMAPPVPIKESSEEEEYVVSAELPPEMDETFKPPRGDESPFLPF